MATPLIKWPGGKRRELSRVRKLVDRGYGLYVEPFVGAGALLFSLEPSRAVINDVNEDLMGLYGAVVTNDGGVRSLLTHLALVWDRDLSPVVAQVGHRLVDHYLTHREARLDVAVSGPVSKFSKGASQGLGPPEALEERLMASIASKARRVARLEEKHDMSFSKVQLADHFETALRAGFYTFVRDDVELTGPQNLRLARFVFVRSYCYGSMFRFNKQGRFNIPYGGINYNANQFERRVDALFSPERRLLLEQCEMACEDFRTFFETRRSGWGPDTFVFLDPPYDSDFSDYDQYPFSLDDQAALADIVGGLQARFVLIIKDTPAIRALYGEQRERCRRAGRDLIIDEYAKTYTYNVRGRNARQVTHLFIHNMMKEEA